jgi:hypothetical protein
MAEAHVPRLTPDTPTGELPQKVAVLMELLEGAPEEPYLGANQPPKDASSGQLVKIAERAGLAYDERMAFFRATRGMTFVQAEYLLKQLTKGGNDASYQN